MLVKVLIQRRSKYEPIMFIKKRNNSTRVIKLL